MKLLLIDNYDSFTYNIVELLRSLSISNFTLVKNEVSIAEASGYSKIILSPGPATPSESGNILGIIKALGATHSLLGICLGHQAIAQAYGATLRQLEHPYHGFQTRLNITERHKIFDFPHQSDLVVGLYHSWVVDEQEFPDCLTITSRSHENHIMSIRHKTHDVHGVQFHPESYMTGYGREMLSAFLS